MPGSDAPRKREDTEWPEHADRVKSNAQRQKEYRERKKLAAQAGADLPDDPAGPPPIPADPEPEAEMAQDPSVRDAVRRSLADWGKTLDPLAAIAVGLAKAFDDAVKDGAGGTAATVSEKLTNTLDRLRPPSGSGSVPADPDSPAKVTDPAELIKRRKNRLAEAAGER